MRHGRIWDRLARSGGEEKTEVIIVTGVPEEIAPAVVCLASSGACYNTGQVLSVNGGLTMM